MATSHTDATLLELNAKDGEPLSSFHEGPDKDSKQNEDGDFNNTNPSSPTSAVANYVDLQGINFDDGFGNSTDDDDHAWNSSLEDAIRSAELWGGQAETLQRDEIGETVSETQTSQTTLVVSEHDHEKWSQATVLLKVELEDAHRQQGPFETKILDAQVDIEDIGGKVRRPFRRGIRKRQKIGHETVNDDREYDVDSAPLPQKRFFSVTDVSSLSYCELQRYYTLTAPHPLPPSAVMDNGTRIHRELELQVHDIVPVKTSTREEGWGVRIYNMLAGLMGAAETGITRELGVLGFVDGLGLVVGVIDGIEKTGDWEWRISDTKTKTGSRYTPVGRPWSSNALDTGPVNPGWVQVMLYKRLFDSLVDMASADSTAIDAWIEKVCGSLAVNPDASFSHEFVLQMNGLHTGMAMADDLDKDSPLLSTAFSSAINDVLSMQPSGNPNLRLIFQRLFRTISVFPYISPNLVIKYINQNTMQEWSEDITYSDTFLNGKLKRAAEFWKEGRKAEGVPDYEAGKCRVCDFGETCTWRQRKIAERLKAAMSIGGRETI